MANITRTIDDHYGDLTDTEVDEETEDEDEIHSDFEDFKQTSTNQTTEPRKRKKVSLCRHKLQGQTSYRSRSWKHPANEVEVIKDANETDYEWAQLQRMEKL